MQDMLSGIGVKMNIRTLGQLSLIILMIPRNTQHILQDGLFRLTLTLMLYGIPHSRKLD
jgi:hypothetical protein